jgi:beta-lactamase regulating signal transducer with metallopeptidase domain
MDAILIYFLKANGLLISFYLVYYFLLRKETFFIKSRYFLLFGLVASILLPLLTFTKTVWVEPNPIEMESTFSSVIPVSNQVLITSEIPSSLNWNEIMYSVYALITIVLFLKIIIELLSFLKFIRIGVRSINENYILIDHPENQNPFSFFHYIVYNSSQFTTAELQHILEHEKIHVLQKHSLDVLLAKLFCVFFWMNPIMWFYRKEMLQNLEYIADNFASLQVSNSVNYQKTLLKVVLNQHQLTITNQFYQSLIKKRIVMLNKNQSNKKNF